MYGFNSDTITTVPPEGAMVILKSGKPVFLTPTLETEIMNIIGDEPINPNGFIVPSNHLFLNEKETRELRNRNKDQKILAIEAEVNELMNLEVGGITPGIRPFD